MQEDYAHLTKRHAVLSLFHTVERPLVNKSDWLNPQYHLPMCDNACIVIAKFKDDHQEEVFFCNRLPHWWYVDLKGRSPVIQDEIIEWKYLS